MLDHQHFFRAFVLISSLALVAGCGGSDDPAGGGGGSGGVGNTGGAGGIGGAGGTGGVGGTGAVEGEPPRIEDPSGIAIIAADEARRGPVLLRFELGDVAAEDTAFRLERQVGESWEPASAAFTRDGDRLLARWDSFADFAGDGAVSLRLVVDETAPVITEPFVVQLRNDPETDRIIAVAHGSILEGGAAVARGTEISAFTWSSTESGEHRRITVGTGPAKMSSAPHGRAIAVLNMTSSTVSIVETPLDASVDELEEIHEFALPYGSLQDVQWSPDGRYLYVLGTVMGSSPSALWRIEPSEGLTSISEPHALVRFPGNGMRFVVDPTSGRMLVGVFDFNEGQIFLSLHEEDGKEVKRIAGGENLRGLNDLAISPAGDYVVASTKVFGDEVHVLRIDGDTLEDVTMRTDVRAPSGIFFHPASTPGDAAALVANFSTNRATPLLLSGAEVEVGTPVAGLPLGAYIDGISRGENAGLVFIPTVNVGSNVTSAQFDLDGTIVVGEDVASFGSGAESLPDGIAVQR